LDYAQRKAAPIRTANIDRIAREGMSFTDDYGQQSCTAGRSAFLLGQSPGRTEHLPTMHGFDEFFGNLYHLNAEEEPEQADYPSLKDFPSFTVDRAMEKLRQGIGSH
jgi:arylsulfatase A-like enzyme